MPQDEAYRKKLKDYLDGKEAEQEEGRTRVMEKAATGQPPDRSARVLRTALKLSVDKLLVDRNLEEAEKLAADPLFDRKSNPAIARWYSQSPYHVSVAKPDLEAGTLQEVEKLFYRINDPLRPLTEDELQASARITAGPKAKAMGEFRKSTNIFGGTPEDESARMKDLEKATFESELAERRKEEIAIASSDKVGFWENIGLRFKENPAFFAPFISGAVDAGKAYEVYQWAKAVEDGTATPEQADALLRFARLDAALQRRGRNLAGDIGAIAQELPAFLGEFAATGGAYSTVKGVVLKGGQKTAEGVIKGSIRKLLTNRLSAAAVGAAAQTALASPFRIAGETVQRMTPTGQIKTIDGEMHYEVDRGSGEKVWRALPKALVSAFAEIASERAGGALEIFDKPINNLLLGAFRVKHPGATGAMFRAALKAGGVHGMIGEIGEERLASLIEAVGHEGIESGSGEFGKIIPSAQQFGAEAIAFSVLPFGAAAIDRIGSRHARARADAFKEIGKLLDGAKITEIAPQELEGLLERVVAGTEQETTYIEPEVWTDYWQSKAIDPRAAAEEAGVSSSLYNERVTSKAPIPFKTSKFAATILPFEHGQFLADHMKHSPLEASAAEAEEFEKSADEVNEGLAPAAVQGADAAQSMADLPPEQAESIKQSVRKARQDTGASPIMATPEIIEAQKRADIAAQVWLRDKMLAQQKRAKNAEWKAEAAEIRETVTADVNSRPEYQIVSAMETGKTIEGVSVPGVEGGLKLLKSPSAYKKYGKGIVGAIPEKYLADEGGLTPSDAAFKLGLDSGAELLNILINTEEREALIERSVQEEMTARHGDMRIDGTLDEEAVKAAYNEKQAQVHLKELEYLKSNDFATLKNIVRKITDEVPNSKALMSDARKAIGNQVIADIVPAVYRRAAQKSAKEARELMLKGDFQGAFDAKLLQVKNHYRFLAAQEAVDHLKDSFTGIVKKVRQSDKKLAKSRDIDYINAARAILASYGIGRSQKSASDHLKQTKEYSDPSVYEHLEERVDGATEAAGPYKQVQYSKVAAAIETIEALWEQSIKSRQVEINGKKEDRNEVVESLVKTAKTHWQPFKDAGKFRSLHPGLKLLRLFNGFKAWGRRMEPWTEAMGGRFKEVLHDQVNDGSVQYRKYRTEQTEKLTDLFKPFAKSLWKRGEIEAPELKYTFDNLGHLVGALMHRGNDSNFTKNAVGRGWATVDDEGNIDYSKWDAFEKRMQDEGILTKEHYDLVQDVWNLFEEMKPLAQKVHKDLYGYYFKEVEARGFTNRFGSYRGGYVPAIADADSVQDVQMKQDQRDLEEANDLQMFPSTGEGFTKTRSASYLKPLTMNLNLLPGAIERVSRFIHIQPRVKEIAKIVNDRRFSDEINKVDNKVLQGLVMPYLHRQAQQAIYRKSTTDAGRKLDAGLNALRKRAGQAYMTGNVVNAMQQVTGISNAAIKVKPKYLRDAFYAYLKSPIKTGKEISEASEVMNQRITTRMIESNNAASDVLLNPSVYTKAGKFIDRHAYFLQQFAQSKVDVIVWSAAYEQAVAEQNASHEDAVKEADSIVRTTQGEFTPGNMSAFEAGTPFVRLFTMFMSYHNMKANLVATELVKTYREMGLKRGFGRAAYILSLGYGVDIALSTAISALLYGALDDDDDDSILTALLWELGRSGGRDSLSGIPFGSAFFRVLDRQLDEDTRGGFKVGDLTPLLKLFEDAFGAIRTIPAALSGKGKASEGFKDVMSIMNLLTVFPTGSLSKPGGYGIDVLEGEQEPEGALDVLQGLTTGRQYKSRRIMATGNRESKRRKTVSLFALPIRDAEVR